MLNKAFNREDATIGYKLSTSNIGASGKKIVLPLYMAMYLQAAQLPVRGKEYTFILVAIPDAKDMEYIQKG